MKNGIIIEICAGSAEDCLQAARVPETDRIELNSSLELGGITPSLSSLLFAKGCTDKKILCMVRPRPAGFRYTETEKEIMYRDAEIFLEHGADGIVFGSLNEDHTVDTDFTRRMAQLIRSYGREAVFHKAFDLTPDPFRACEVLIGCGVNRILTSGQAPAADGNMTLICALNNRYGKDIEILPGGGVSEDSIRTILEHTGCHSIHMSAKVTRDDDGSYYAVSSERIGKILEQIPKKKAKAKLFTREDAEMMTSDIYEDSLIDHEEEERRS